MFFQGLFSTPLPYLVMAFVYMIGLFPGALKSWTGTDENELIASEINVEPTVVDVWDELTANETAVYSNWQMNVAAEPVEPICNEVSEYWKRTHYPTAQPETVFKIEWWASIVSRPPPVA